MPPHSRDPPPNDVPSQARRAALPKTIVGQRDRRNLYLNLGFGLAVVAAVVILGVAVGWRYYNDHLASVGSVDGQSITKDELRDRTRSSRGGSTANSAESNTRPRRAS